MMGALSFVCRLRFTSGVSLEQVTDWQILIMPDKRVLFLQLRLAFRLRSLERSSLGRARRVGWIPHLWCFRRSCARHLRPTGPAQILPWEVAACRGTARQMWSWPPVGALLWLWSPLAPAQMFAARPSRSGRSARRRPEPWAWLRVRRSCGCRSRSPASAPGSTPRRTTGPRCFGSTRQAATKTPRRSIPSSAAVGKRGRCGFTSGQWASGACAVAPAACSTDIGM
mmetsp:Transcript_129917/g.308242  ORF Transcript_129917/g.308242 Transcript_129917/m.308242 type:complete len:226 (+) Transcript_129917:1132-1809(+)